LQIVGDIVGNFFEPFEQHLDTLKHQVQIHGKAIKLIVGIVDWQAAGQVTGHDRARRFGHGIDASEHTARDEKSASQAKHDDERNRPAASRDDDVVEALALFKIAADEKPKTTLELRHAHECAVLAAVGIVETAIDRFGPSRLIENPLTQGRNVSDQ